MFCHLQCYTGRRTGREIRAFPAEQRPRKHPANLYKVKSVPPIFQVIHFLIHILKWCHIIMVTLLCRYVLRKIVFFLFLVQSKTEREEHVQMPQQCSLAEQVETCSTLLPIYSTKMGCSAFTECLLLGEPAPSC